ncbi:hypothetical protein EDC01DRAFT_784937 [Geopyxis carbonaria]|nr:hypothetical protein EDC01DRAFT_784937 [Geopyxis carbonaria]
MRQQLTLRPRTSGLSCSSSLSSDNNPNIQMAVTSNNNISGESCTASSNCPIFASTGIPELMEPPAQADDAWQQMVNALPIAQQSAVTQLAPIMTSAASHYDTPYYHQQQQHHAAQQQQQHQLLYQERERREMIFHAQQQQQQQHEQQQQQQRRHTQLQHAQQQHDDRLGPQYYSPSPAAPAPPVAEVITTVADYSANIVFPGWPPITLIFYPNASVHLLVNGRAEGMMEVLRDDAAVRMIDGDCKVAILRSPTVRQVLWLQGSVAQKGMEYHVLGGKGVQFQEVQERVGGYGGEQGQGGYETQTGQGGQSYGGYAPQQSTPADDVARSPSPVLPTTSTGGKRKPGPGGGKESRLKPVPLSSKPKNAGVKKAAATRMSAAARKAAALAAAAPWQGGEEMGPPSKRTRRSSKANIGAPVEEPAKEVAVGVADVKIEGTETTVETTAVGGE